MNIVRIYGTGSATANAVASVIIPKASRIRGVQWSAVLDSITDSSRMIVELSRASASEIAVVGSQQCISEIAAMQNLLTSGMGPTFINLFAPVDVSVVQGQIIYMHALISGTASFIATALIHYS